MGITALGTERGLETKLVPQRGYELALIPAVPLPRKPTPELITRSGPGCAARSRRPSRSSSAPRRTPCRLRRYVALPGYLAAKRLGVPIVIHEANARPGLANKIGPRYAAQVAVATPDSKLRNSRYIGIPLRHTIATLDRAAAPARGSAHVRPRPQPAHPAGLRRLAGRPPPQRGRPAGRAVAAAGRHPDPARGRPEERTAAGAADARDAPLHPGKLPGPDGPRVRRCRHDALPRGRDDRRRTLRRRAPGPPTSRCPSAKRRTAAERPAGGSGHAPCPSLMRS